MNIKIKTILTSIPFVTLLLVPCRLPAADASSMTGSLVRSSNAATAGAVSGTVTPSSLVMIENRARVLGNRLANGIRYFAVTDSDLIGKTPAEIMQRLSPSPIRAGDGVRSMEIVVDLKRPLTLYTSGGEPNIGTAIIQASPSLRQVEIHSSIFANLTVIDKGPNTNKIAVSPPVQ
jgi:hypothetical protein